MHPAVVVTTVLGGIFTVALAAVLFAQKGQAPQVIQQAGSALTSVINAAVSPVTGQSVGTNLGNSLGNSLGSTTTGGL